MSETVHYRGTAKRVDLQGLTNEEFAKDYLDSRKREISSYYNNAVECLTEIFYNEFFFYPRNQSLYQLTREIVDVDDDIIRAEFDPASDKINYELRYYNGGVGFEECLEEAFDKIIR